MRRPGLKTIFLTLLVATAPMTVIVAPHAAHAAEIKFVVNGNVVTTTDIQRRAAFLKLQRAKGNLNKEASDQMVEQTLRLAEMKRLGINIPDKQVDEAYARFAASNKMQLKQLDMIMAQSGVTKQHFKQFIKSQMGWGQVVGMRARGMAQAGSKPMSEREAVEQMFKKEGRKASAEEYLLQQVIFVVPPKERGKIGARKREAEQLRARYNGCEGARQLAKGLIDVTVRDLGRTTAPRLPPEWAESIKATKPGKATPVRETEKGVEFIGVCSSREITDDRVSQDLILAENAKSQDGDALSKSYMDELKKNAKITSR